MNSFEVCFVLLGSVDVQISVFVCNEAGNEGRDFEETSVAVGLFPLWSSETEPIFNGVPRGELASFAN